MNRRDFLMGVGGAVLAAPAIVRVAGNLMPISAATPEEWVTISAPGWYSYAHVERTVIFQVVALDAPFKFNIGSLIR